MKIKANNIQEYIKNIPEDRKDVFDKLMKLHPEMHITHMGSLTKDLNSKYLYNFWKFKATKYHRCKK